MPWTIGVKKSSSFTKLTQSNEALSEFKESTSNTSSIQLSESDQKSTVVHSVVPRSNTSPGGSSGSKPGSSPVSEGSFGAKPKQKTSSTSCMGSRSGSRLESIGSISGSTPSPPRSSGSRSKSTSSPVKSFGSRHYGPSRDGSQASSLGSVELKLLKSSGGARPTHLELIESPESQMSLPWGQTPPNMTGLDGMVLAPKTPGKITTKGRLVQYSLGPPL